MSDDEKIKEAADKFRENVGGALKLVVSKSDKEIADDIKARLKEAMQPVLALFDEAASHGMAIQWATIQPQPPYFKHGIGGLTITKIL